MHAKFFEETRHSEHNSSTSQAASGNNDSVES